MIGMKQNPAGNSTAIKCKGVL